MSPNSQPKELKHFFHREARFCARFQSTRVTSPTCRRDISETVGVSNVFETVTCEAP